MSYNLKTIKQEFKNKGIFYTQTEQAEYIKSLLPDNVDVVYDPTCGSGGLLCVFSDDVKKYGQEINPEQLKVAQDSLVNFIGACGDTLINPAFTDIKFDYIVANPPFSISWEQDKRFEVDGVLPPKSKADYAFNLHILNCLSDKGIAVVINFPGILYRGNAEGKIRKWIIEQNYIEKVIALPGKKFIDTPIPTCIIVYNKNKQNTDIQFIHDESGKTYTASIDEVRKNNYNLSANNYINLLEPLEQIDVIEVDRLARNDFCKRLKNELEFEKSICMLEPKLNFKSFITDIQNIIKDYA